MSHDAHTTDNKTSGEIRCRSDTHSWSLSLVSGLVAAVISSVIALIGIHITADSGRDQARDDYLRAERRDAYADFEGCLRDMHDAFASVFSYGNGYVTEETRYPLQSVDQVYNADDCLGQAYLTVTLIAPSDIAHSCWIVVNYYGLRVEHFRGLVTALSKTPVDTAELTREQSQLSINSASVDIGSLEKQPISDVESGLISDMRRNLGIADTL